MASCSRFLPAPLTFLLLLSFAVGAHGHAKASDSFVVEGKVYCDNCRAGFETTVTEYISGAEVKLECRNDTTNEILHTAEGVTDSSGTYSIEVRREHEDEICEVILTSSPMKECSEIRRGRDRARVQITMDAGMSSKVRHVNSLGFLRIEPLTICGELLAQYGLGDEE